MQGFMGIGGKNSKQQNQSIDNLSNLFNFGMDTAKKDTASGNATTNAGLSGLGDANSYFKSLTTGNRAAMQQAEAPAINATVSGADAARRQQEASGTARGGGVAGQNQQQQTDTMAKIDNALFGVRPAAAQQEAATSGKIADVGTQQRELGLQAAGIGGTAASNAGSIATNARQQAAQEQAAAIQMAIGAIFG
jgi:hypothetical protein